MSNSTVKKLLFFSGCIAALTYLSNTEPEGYTDTGLKFDETEEKNITTKNNKTDILNDKKTAEIKVASTLQVR